MRPPVRLLFMLVSFGSSRIQAFLPISSSSISRSGSGRSSGSKTLSFRLSRLSRRDILSATSNSLTSNNPNANDNDNDNDVNNMDSETVRVIICTTPSKSNPTKITLIGTAHLSQASNDQVTRIIAREKPDVVAIELDATRLPRIGYSSIAELMENTGIPHVVTAADIPPPFNAILDAPAPSLLQQPIRWWQRQFQSLASQFLAQVARRFLTSRYQETSQQLGGQAAGGEFIAAIQAASLTGVKKLVLADSESTQTLQRAIAMAFVAPGGIGAFVTRLEQVNAEELQDFQAQVMQENTSLSSEYNNENMSDTESKNNDNGSPELTVAMMEALKADTKFRTRLFDRLEQEVPEFTTTFGQERDCIMAKAIAREILDHNASHVVAVVGLAHVPGIEQQLQQLLFQNDATASNSSTTTSSSSRRINEADIKK